MRKIYSPSISAIIATYNSERTLDACLESIRKQNYPQKKIEIIIVDGGSNDKTLEIARKYKCKIIIRSGSKAEEAKAYGLQKAKGELIADFGSDNILPEKNWLKKITAPFTKDQRITASYPLYYAYVKTETPFNRYVAMFGVNDPIPYYLNKADKQSCFQKGYKLAGEAVDKGNYFKVKFSAKNLPTVGANGFIIKREILKKAKVDPKYYFHIDVVYDVVKKGYNTFAVVKNSIIHKTGDTLFSLLRKRNRYFTLLYLTRVENRRYHIVSSNNYLKLFLFIIFSLTLIQPSLVSLKGFLKKRDPAWFLHPIFCFTITLIYTKAVFIYLFRKWRKL